MTSTPLRQDAHKLLMMPDPAEYGDAVLRAITTPDKSHFDPTFIGAFGSSIELLRKVFLAPTGQPFVLAGPGTMTWDIAAANLVEPGETVLFVNTGISGDWFAACLGLYGAEVDQLRPPFGDRPTLAANEAQLRTKQYKLISMTHVDRCVAGYPGDCSRRPQSLAEHADHT